jgi:hypothetical protein
MREAYAMEVTERRRAVEAAVSLAASLGLLGVFVDEVLAGVGAARR